MNSSIKPKTVEDALIRGIKKTINRFRERPMNYFTESDIHSSLIRDIMEGNSEILLYRDRKSNMEVSLLHNEYPTSFRYQKKKLLNDYTENTKAIIKETNINNGNGDRGGFDLSILSEDFVKRMFENEQLNLNETIKHIINKDIRYAKRRSDNLYFTKEIPFAIEVKFIQSFNARNIELLRSIIKDNSKLNLTRIHSNCHTKTINLIFCSSEKLTRFDKKTSIICKIKKYIKEKEIEFDNSNSKKIYSIPEGVINIFIQSFYFKDSNSKYKECDKVTPKPIISIGGNNEKDSFFQKLKSAMLNTE